MNKNQQFYHDLYLAEKHEQPTPQQLASFIIAKQSELAGLLGKEDSDELGLDDIISLREQLSLPEYISLDAFNKLTQFHIGKDIATIERYNELLQLPDHRKLLEVHSHQPPKVEKLIKYQGSKLAQGLVEIVANAIDASNPNQTVGRFGEGFYQALKFLEDPTDVLQVSTRAREHQGFDIMFKEDTGIKIGTLHNNALQMGTTVSLQKELSDASRKQLTEFVTSRFATNTYAHVYLNGTLINNFSATTVINGKRLNMSGKPAVYITVDEHGFSVKDAGIGMDSKTIAEKLVYPTGSSKKKINPGMDDLPSLVKKESKFFYTQRAGTNQSSTIRLQVAGVVIEEFQTETVGKIDAFTLECPSFTRLPESRNQIIPERCVVLTIQHALEKIQQQGGSLEEKIMLTEMMGKIINKLKQRKTDETKKEYALEHVAKQAFVPLRDEIEKAGGVVLPGDKQLMNRLGEQPGVYYVSPDFVDLKVETIPGSEPIEHVVEDSRYQQFLRKRSFFAVPFGDAAVHDYLITPQAVLVNKTILEQGDMQRQLLNTSINLNIGYELPEETVYYGRIEDTNVYLANKKEQEQAEAYRKAQLDETKRAKEEKEQAEKERITALAKHVVEKYGDFLLSEENDHNTALHILKKNSDGIYELLQEVVSNDLSVIDSPEAMLACCITSTRSPEISRHMHHKKYYTKLSDFVLNNTNTVISSLIKGVSGSVKTIKDGATSADVVLTLIELYDKEPEYMMKIVERFDKDYVGNTGWDMFTRFLTSHTITSKTVEKRFEIPYDEIAENIFTHPAMGGIWRAMYLDKDARNKCLSKTRATRYMPFNIFERSSEEMCIAYDFVKSCDTLPWALVDDYGAALTERTIAETRIALQNEIASSLGKAHIDTTYASAVIDMLVFARNLQKEVATGLAPYLEKRYQQEQQLAPFLKSFDTGDQWEHDMGTAFYALRKTSEHTWEKPFGLEYIDSVDDGFMGNLQSYRHEVDRILLMSEVKNIMEKVRTEHPLLGEDPNFDVLYPERKISVGNFRGLAVYFSSLMKQIQIERPGISVSFLYYHIFIYYSRKEYCKKQLQTNTIFRSSLCDLMDMQEMQLANTDERGNDSIRRECTEYLGDFFRDGDDSYSFPGVDEDALMRTMIQIKNDCVDKNLLLTKHAYLLGASVNFHTQGLDTCRTLVNAGRTALEHRGDIDDGDWENMMQGCGFEAFESSTEVMTIDNQQALCVYYYLYFKLLQQKKREKEITNESIVPRNELEEMNERILPLLQETSLRENISVGEEGLFQEKYLPYLKYIEQIYIDIGDGISLNGDGMKTFKETLANHAIGIVPTPLHNMPRSLEILRYFHRYGGGYDKWKDAVAEGITEELAVQYLNHIEHTFDSKTIFTNEKPEKNVQREFTQAIYLYDSLLEQLQALEREDIGVSKLDTLNNDLWSQSYDSVLSKVERFDDGQKHRLHLAPLLQILENISDDLTDRESRDECMAMFPDLSFLRQHRNRVKLSGKGSTGRDHIRNIFTDFYCLFEEFTPAEQTTLLAIVQGYDLSGLFALPTYQVDLRSKLLDVNLFDHVPNKILREINAQFVLLLKITSVLTLSRKEGIWEQPEKYRETMFDMRYSRVFEEIMQVDRHGSLLGLAGENDNIPVFAILQKMLENRFPDIIRHAGIAFLSSLKEARLEGLSENLLRELSNIYTDRYDGLRNEGYDYREMISYLEKKNMLSSEFVNKFFTDGTFNYLGGASLGSAYLLEQRIISFLKELDQQPGVPTGEHLPTNELEVVKKKIPISLDVGDSRMVSQLCMLFHNERDALLRGQGSIDALLQTYPAFRPLKLPGDKISVSDIHYLIATFNDEVLCSLQDNDRELFLAYAYELIGDSDVYSSAIKAKIIAKFGELTGGNLDQEYSWALYTCLLGVYARIYQQRTSGGIVFPEEYQSTMFDQKYNEVFNMIMTTDENNIFERDNLITLGLSGLVRDLCLLEGQYRTTDIVTGLEVLSSVYLAGYAKGARLMHNAFGFFKSSWELENVGDSIFEEDATEEQFIEYLIKESNNKDIHNIIRKYKGLLFDIVAGVEYEKTIIQSLDLLKEIKIDGSSGPTKESIISELSKTYPQDLIVFAQFLLEGGELLKEGISAIAIEGELSRCKLSDLIGMSRFMPQDIVAVQDKEQLDTLIASFSDNETFSSAAFTRDIYSSIEGQDKSSMIHIREKIQNGIDAIQKARRQGDDVPEKMDVTFFAEQGNRVTQVQDPVGMDLHKVLNYLLIPGNSDKDGDGGQTGMFGQGFWSSAIGAKELRIKTSPGDGHLYQLTLLPIYNADNNLDDFDVSVSVSEADFKGTIIERVDDKSGIQANLRAMIGVHNMQKYVGNVESIDIMYGNQKINTPEKNITLQTVAVPGYGEMKLIKTSDNIVRRTKDHLYINEIPDDFLEDLPVWMQEYIHSQHLTINIPSSCGLTKSRNSMADYEQQVHTLRPHLFEMFISYILHEVVTSKVRIPMLPEDYFGLDTYERRGTEASRIAGGYIAGRQLTDQELIYLQDKAHMAEFLVQIPFEREGEKLSLLDMKRQRDSEKMKRMMSKQPGLFSEQFTHYAENADGLNRNMEQAERTEQSLEKTAEILGIGVERVENFLRFVEQDPGFKETLQGVFKDQDITSYEHTFYLREGGESRAALYGIKQGKAYMVWNLKLENQIRIGRHLMKWIEAIEADPQDEEIIREMRETISHEFVHEMEVLLLDKPKRGTHEKDLEHDESFEKMQRDLLTQWTRNV